MYTAKSYDELETIINAWLNGDTEDDDNNFGTSRGTSSSSSETTPAAKKSGGDKYKNLDDAFADLDDDF